MTRTEFVHQRFRGAVETVKQLNVTAVALELGAAAIAVLSILGTKSPWFPFVVLVLAVVSAAVRAYGGEVRSFALACRKASIRAFAFEQDLDPLTASRMDVEAPGLAEWNAKRLPAPNLLAYYEPTCPTGPPRLREIYAHSAFYTWSLLKVYSFMQATLAIVILFGSFAVFYDLAGSQSQTVDRISILDALCTVVLVVIGIRAGEKAWSCYSAKNSIKSIEQELLQGSDGMQDLIDEYDLTLATTPDVPTWVYRWKRNKLQQQWHKRREAFEICSQKETINA